jgi:integral membrane protein
MFSLLKSFRIIAILEGISYLVLFANMLLVKPNAPELYHSLLFPIGMTHGLLFMAYIVLALLVGAQLKWKSNPLWIVLIASIIPFGTFYIEKKYLTQKQA